MDLAGAERFAKTGATGMRMKEAGNINQSLLTLGKCIEAMKRNQSKRYMGLALLILPVKVPRPNGNTLVRATSGRNLLLQLLPRHACDHPVPGHRACPVAVPVNVPPQSPPHPHAPMSCM